MSIQNVNQVDMTRSVMRSVSGIRHSGKAHL